MKILVVAMIVGMVNLTSVDPRRQETDRLNEREMGQEEDGHLPVVRVHRLKKIIQQPLLIQGTAVQAVVLATGVVEEGEEDQVQDAKDDKDHQVDLVVHLELQEVTVVKEVAVEEEAAAVAVVVVSGQQVTKEASWDQGRQVDLQCLVVAVALHQFLISVDGE